MRYHIVSLAAVFLALALGIVLGATKINSPLLAGLQGDNDSLVGQRDGLAEENERLGERITADAQFASAIGPLAVRSTLPDTQVVLITTDATDPTDRDAVLSLLQGAGAVVATQVQLTADFSDPDRADQLRDLAIQNLPASATLPESSNAGTIAGGFLANLLLTDLSGQVQVSAPEALSALSALSAAGFINPVGEVAPGNTVVLLSGAALTGDAAVGRAQMLVDVTAALKNSAQGVVLAGRSGSEGDTGSVGLVRADTAASALVSTVDNLESDMGRIATVLALVEQNGGGIGRYGLGDNAHSPIPRLAVG